MSSIKHHVSGVEYWRSLEQLADGPQVRELLHAEFAGYNPDEIQDGASRRSFLKIMGASLALAGVTLSGCRRWPKERLAPYTSNPRERIPGVPEQFATVWELGGVAVPLLVTSYDGRPIKIEGNPSHPFSWTIPGKIGSADAFAQASILEMYDPQRSRRVVDRSRGMDQYTDWDTFAKAISAHLKQLKDKAASFAILSEATVSPTVLDLKKKLLAAYPGAKWYEYEPLNSDSEREGAKLAFGKPVRTRFNLDKAQTIVLLDADLFGTHPAHTRYAADWSAGRRSADGVDGKEQRMNRVYIAESAFTVTGSIADYRIGIDPSRIDVIARNIAANLDIPGVEGGGLNSAESQFVLNALTDLRAVRWNKASVVAAGPTAPPHVHALVHAINEKLGAIGTTVTLVDDPAGDQPGQMAQITELTAAMSDGKIDTLLILGGNPIYDAPNDLNFAEAIKKVPNSVRLGLYFDETSVASKWHLPRAHYLEAWGDSLAWDGTPSVAQPLIEPLYGGKSVIELLALLLGDTVTDGEHLVRRTWQRYITSNFESTWRATLEAGLLADAAPKPIDAKVNALQLPPLAASRGQANTATLRFTPDARTYDGRFANNGWLQETPDPVAKLMWDNAAMVSKVDADRWGITTGDMIRLTTPTATLDIAAYVLPGQPANVIAVSLGYGRTAAGHIGDNLGFNTYYLRNSHSPYAQAGVTVTKLGATYKLVATQNHHLIDSIGQEARDERIGPKHHDGRLIREATFTEFKEHPYAAHEVVPGRVGLQLFQPPTKFTDTHAWGMSVDMNACIGCMACALACQAENNIPIVGKEQALNHREMNWIRIDRYFKGDPDDSNSIEVIYQPVMCQHCENAPCEQVCPVAATTHDSEGLNVMVYNRCVGTRYCSNNCPYKVRRFNYFDFHSQDPRNTWGVPYLKPPDMQQNEQVDPIKRMVFNPEVTVRMRGVMEKCTYCVQRIHKATIAARTHGPDSDVKDGDIITACQQACPTQAIVFGNLLDKEAKVTNLHKNARAYAMLDDELDTKPRTMYLAKLRNPVDTGEVQENKG